MNLKRKHLLVSTLSTFFLIIFIYFASSRIVLSGFSELENERVVENTEKVLNTVANELEQLGKSNDDWAYWDDTYQFIQDRNEEYRISNLETESILNLQVDTMIFLDESSEIVFDISLNPVTYEEIQTEESLKDYLMNKDFGENGVAEGILVLDKVPILFTIRPILTSSQEGPTKGYLFFAKHVDKEWNSRISKITGYDTSFFVLDNSGQEQQDHILGETSSGKVSGLSITAFVSHDETEKNPEFLEIKENLKNEEDIVVKTIDEETISSSVVLNDFDGNSALLLKVIYPRSIYNQGKESVNYLFYSIILLGILLGLVNVFTYQKMFVSKISLLAGEVESLNEKNITDFDKYNSEDSEISALGAKIKKMYVELKELDSIKTNFLNIVSHELKTPLTAIYAYLGVLSDSKGLSQDDLKSLEAIKRNSEQLKILITNILEISRIEAGKFELSQNEINPEEKINNVVSNLKILAEKKGLRLVSKTENLPKTMVTDEPRFEEIFNNLVSNAIKFTDKGSVTIGAKVEKDFIVFKVKDTGVGIPKEKIGELFKKFYQVDSSISRKYGGTGLGLSITKQLVELQGGKIWAESVKDGGTTFYFTLPIDGSAKSGLNGNACVGDRCVSSSEIEVVEKSFKNERRKK